LTAARSAVTTRRMPRAQRREQILGAATRAFARAGFTNTGLDVIAAEAGVTPVILPRRPISTGRSWKARVPGCARSSGQRPSMTPASRHCCEPPPPTRTLFDCSSATPRANPTSATSWTPFDRRRPRLPAATSPISPTTDGAAGRRHYCRRSLLRLSSPGSTPAAPTSIKRRGVSVRSSTP
jgi:hypothetical protein